MIFNYLDLQRGNMLENEIKSEKHLYREIFLEAKNKLFEQIQLLKSNFNCKDCHKCCKLYAICKSNFSLNSEDDTETLKMNLKFFKDNFSLISDENIDNELSQEELSEKNNYIHKFSNNLDKTEFYRCINLKDNKCSSSEKSSFCNSKNINIDTILHDHCEFKQWQFEVKKLLAIDTANNIHKKLKTIDNYKDKFSCQMTGTCCKLSSSEFSYDELKSKAANGDIFAQQFTSIFIPYNSSQEASKIFPEYVEFVLKSIGEDETVHFYHCPHIDKNNLCSIYNTNKRPQICKDFPNNPLAILYPGCGYYHWKKEVLPSVLLCHALIEICSFLLDKMEVTYSQ